MTSPNSTVFTDDDLKRLKEDFNDHAMHTGRPFPLTQGTLDALLARLEAAERVCKWAKSFDDEPRVVSIDGTTYHLNAPLMQEMLLAFEAWRKAVGK